MLPACMSVYIACGGQERVLGFPGAGGRQLWAAMRTVLEMQPGYSARAANTVNTESSLQSHKDTFLQSITFLAALLSEVSVTCD